MIRALRQLAGAALGVAGVALPAWAIFHLIRQPSCGDVGQAACPDEVGVWIGVLIGSVVVLLPLAILVAGSDRVTGRRLLAGPIFLLAPLAFVAGIVVSLVGASADDGTRWVGIVVGGIVLVIALPIVVGALGRLVSGPSLAPAAGVPPGPDVARAEQLSTLASSLGQVATTRDRAARLEELKRLHASGLIDADELRRRRDEILGEI